MLQALIGPISNLVGGYMKNKAEEKQAKHQAKINVIQNDANWEQTMAAASSNSYKDEFWTLVLSLPLFMVGYAIASGDTSVIDRVHLGFAALSELPEWYQYLLFIAISSSFGIRGVSKLMDLRK
tara:strand:- start:576 stop:947 length:372 start_codon:yes stop_codon:yes gene_type:complete